MAPEPSPRFGAPESSGADLLHPDAGSPAMRRRLERPAQIGRYAFAVLGAVMAGAAVGLWIYRPDELAYGLLVFGIVLLGLSYAQHRLLRQARARCPEHVLLWSEGIELVLANGEIRVAPWNDPKFALDVFVRPGSRGRPDEVSLGWRMDPGIPICPITSDGLDRLRSEIDAHGLRSSEYRGGGGRSAMRGFEFRPFPPAPVPKGPGADRGRAAL